jgi:DNA-binding CsgD family transcriptional regulator
MQTWSLEHEPGTRSQQALAKVIDQVGRPDFARRGLAQLNRLLRVGSWSVYRLHSEQAPVLHLSASQGVADTTAACFAIYRDAGLYRRDRSFEAVRTQRRPGRCMLLRMHASEAPNAEHREAIYQRHGMLERLSVARLDDDGSLLSMNLYRHDAQGSFDGVDVAQLASIAAPLLAAVSRHAGLTTAPRPMGPRAVLTARCPALTSRELDVLERLLQGLTYDGIAADLGLSVGSVKTYRARAFDRLGIHFRNELFAGLLAAAG